MRASTILILAVPHALGAPTAALPGEELVYGSGWSSLDDSDSERQFDLAVTRYLDGMDLRWTGQFTTTNSRRFGDVSMGLIGLSLSF